MKTRLIAKLEIKDENVVKPIYFEGLKKISNFGKNKLKYMYILRPKGINIKLILPQDL